MNYLSEEEVIMAFYNLVGIQSEIYDLTMEKLLQLENDGIKDPLEYDKIVKKISNLKVKENRVYEKLNTSEYYYGLLDVVQKMVREFSIEDEKKYTAIDERLDYHFSDLFNEECAIMEINENIYDYIDIDDDYEGEIVVVPEFSTVDFYTPLQIKFMRELMKDDSKNEEYLKYKFYNSFTHPRLEEELILARYNPNNVYDVDEQLNAELYDMEIDEYKESVDTATENFAESAYLNFVNISIEPEVDKEKLDLAFKETLFATSNLNTKKLAEFVKKHFDSDEEYVVSYDALDYFEKLGNSLLQMIFDREDYDEVILNILNSENVDLDFSSVKFDKETYDNLFNLVNISKEIYFIATNLYCLDLINKKDSEMFLDKLELLEELTKKEAEYAEKLNFDVDEKAAARELISKYLEFIYSLDGRGGIICNDEISNQIINKRINYVLWDEIVPDLSTFKDNSVPHSIIKNFQLECLHEYEKLITGDDKINYLAFKYLEIISNPSLTDEFIFEKGYIENAIILDDEITSKILDVDIDEYLFDKDDLIASNVYDIIASLVKFPKDTVIEGFDKAALDYQTVALEVAFQYVNEDNLNEFKSNFASSEMVENSILGKRLKSIFNKKDKKFELSKKRH
ncbi:MAG: hypothetical protein IKG40_03660 [Bacilli bacterium]|nr:hypothetical protein [Bacilli bacterium]